ncbi:hypothetical protein T03_10664 [Trichinella britovi]|uniref:Uncharacterized protein n=1 Tax=Trichinella britovi TaxID=45882 RepID=A0A0V1D4S9_TRIBR|nr:hypothetical protein T03_10664 [Trichinella britovi]
MPIDHDCRYQLATVFSHARALQHLLAKSVKIFQFIMAHMDCSRVTKLCVEILPSLCLHPLNISTSETNQFI